MLQLHDSLSKTKKPFEPLVPGIVTMYSCGPTVYDDVHIGNLRSFLAADLLRRYLEFKGLAVRQVMNITDVGHMLADADEGEDKMEVSAGKLGKSPEEVATFYTERFFRDIDRLGISRAEAYPKATDHVQEMIALITKLLDTGKAYKVGENVYYDVSTFPAYGKLSGNTAEGLQAGARIEVREEKKHPQDFALWIHNPAHQMQWEAPWGKGYPGWHIECSAMSMKYLGETIDLHTGGEDNKFPHHECEIAQSEGATGKPFVCTWMHVTHLLVDGEKMSKSKGNFFTLDDLLAKGHAARDVRFALLSTHYRQQLNFTLAGIDAARNALARFDEFVDLLRDASAMGTESTDAVAKAKQAFDDAMDDDLNISEALGALFVMMRALNERNAAGTLSEAERGAVLDLMDGVSGVLGLRFGKAVTDEDIPADIRALVDARDAARAKKDWAASDRLRDELKAQGFVIEDTPGGRRIKRV
jgi:cysteinyl-tRNA synthetase